MKRNNDTSRISYGKLFWGLLLVILGVLALFDNLGLASVDWTSLWQLWPIAFIAAGISMLSYNNMYWHIVASVLIIASLSIVAVVGLKVVDISPDMTVNDTIITKSSDNIKQADVLIKAGASAINVVGSEQGEIVKAKFESNIANLKHETSIVDDIQMIVLGMDSNFANRWWMGGGRSNLDVSLIKGLPINFSIESGASDMKIDLSDIDARRVNIKTGVSSLELRVGTHESVVDVNISSGVSSVTINVPKESGVRLNLDGGLNSHSLAGLIKIKENTYESADYELCKNKVNIMATVGVSSFNIDSY